MSKLISIRDDLYEKLKGEKGTGGLSSSEKLDKLCARTKELEDMCIKEHNHHLEFITALQETTVTQEGRISKTLAGKTILYKVKEEKE